MAEDDSAGLAPAAIGLVGRLRRLLAYTAIAIRRSIVQATGSDAGRFWSRVGGVSLAVALMLIVTAIGVGIATQSTVYSDDIDYWITPETEGGSSVLVETDAPRFGSVHEVSDRLREDDDIRYASPVLTQAMLIESPGGEREYVLAIGIVGDDGLTQVSSVTTSGLTAGDPYYANGTYNGNWTGEMVFSAGAASLLDVETGDDITVRRPTVSENQSFYVSNVDAGDQQGSQFPIVVMQLSELQTIGGAAEGDQAEQILVGANDPAVRDRLTDVYPRSTVESRAGVTSQQVFDEELPLALSITAFLIAVVVGTLFVMTMTGLEVTADRVRLGTLAAIGISGSSRLWLLSVQTVLSTLLGGIVGIGLGFAGILAVNEISAAYLTVVSVAASDPLLLPYGLGVSLVIALLSLPYLVVLLRRVGTVAEVLR